MLYSNYIVYVQMHNIEDEQAIQQSTSLERARVPATVGQC